MTVPIVPDQRLEHEAFCASRNKHVLMLTIHGLHEWNVIPGLPDTGGQNVFVNQFSDELATQGFKVTIANRGGYPHPKTGNHQEGLHYRNETQRLVYLDDGLDKFVRKEDMRERSAALKEALSTFAEADGNTIDYLISHYWDAGLVGMLWNEGERLHTWVPHSLGEIKKRNVSPDRWLGLRIEERIKTEREILTRIGATAATSSVVRDSLEEDYGYVGPVAFLPPCVDTDRFHARAIADDNSIWPFLSEASGLPARTIRNSHIVTEISRTDTTKRKDVLIGAFAQVLQSEPSSFLIVSIDESNQVLFSELTGLIRNLGIADRVAVVGSVWEILPAIYAITDVYCTPSIMEGFGMSAEEAAATRVPVVASNLVPFVTEYLLGSELHEIPLDSNGGILRAGEGAIVVEPDDVPGFARALTMLLSDGDLRESMGNRAYQITIPYFTWPKRTIAFLETVGMFAEGG